MTQETADYTISRLESRLASLHDDALLNPQRERLNDVDTLLARLTQQTAALRARGYCYKAHLEGQLTDAAERWPDLRAAATRTIATQSAALRPMVTRCEAAVRALGPLKSRPLAAAQQAIGRAEGEIEAAEGRVRAAQQAVESGYSALYEGLKALEREIGDCERMYGLLEGASFAVEAGESLVGATEARLVAGDDPIPGVLFLTDRRMLFERREKVARKKILFITTESELVKEVRWEAPLTDMERIDASEARRALVMKRETLAVETRNGSRAQPAEFELSTDSDGWRAMVLRCQTGEIDGERAGGAQVVAEYVVPAKCPTCGGAQSRAGRIRGVSSLECEYCGATVALARAEEGQ